MARFVARFVSPHLFSRTVAAVDTKRGYNMGMSNGLFDCLSTTILALQATGRLMSDTNSFSAIYAYRAGQKSYVKLLRGRREEPGNKAG